MEISANVNSFAPRRSLRGGMWGTHMTKCRTCNIIEIVLHPSAFCGGTWGTHMTERVHAVSNEAEGGGPLLEANVECDGVLGRKHEKNWFQIGPQKG